MTGSTYLDWVIENTETVWWHDSADPAELQRALIHGASGATTNPFLASLALAQNRRGWAAEVDAILAKGLGAEEQAEELMSNIVSRAAVMCRPLYERTQGKHGLVCAQVNPSRAGNRAAMFSMARRFHALAPNISVKLPAVAAGLDVLEDCVAEGISTTATVSFTLAQVIAVAERCRAGRMRASRNAIKPGACFAVIMIGRLDDYLRETALDNRAPASESDIRQSGLAVAKRAYEIYQERHYETVLMIAALRGSYHLTELVGAKLIMSIAPAAQLWFLTGNHPREGRIDQRTDPTVIARLSTMPEFVKAYEPDGMQPSEFIAYGATQRTLGQYVEAGWKLLEGFR